MRISFKKITHIFRNFKECICAVKKNQANRYLFKLLPLVIVASEASLGGK